MDKLRVFDSEIYDELDSQEKDHSTVSKHRGKVRIGTFISLTSFQISTLMSVCPKMVNQPPHTSLSNGVYGSTWISSCKQSVPTAQCIQPELSGLQRPNARLARTLVDRIIGSTYFVCVEKSVSSMLTR